MLLGSWGRISKVNSQGMTDTREDTAAQQTVCGGGFWEGGGLDHVVWLYVDTTEVHHSELAW